MTLKEAMLEYVDDFRYLAWYIYTAWFGKFETYEEVQLKEKTPYYIPNKGPGVYYLWGEGTGPFSWHGSTSLDTYKVFNFSSEEGAIHYMKTLFPDYKRVDSEYKLKNFNKYESKINRN